jgi:predicted DNA-binding transcriptional regulator YafY
MDIKQVINRLEIAVHQKKMVKIKYVNYYNVETERYIKEIKFSKRYFDINKKQCIDSQFNHIQAFCILKNQIRIFKINRIQFITDGKDDFPCVKIGNQIWMTENLNVSEFRNGESIKELSRNSSDESGFYSYPQKKRRFYQYRISKYQYEI